jgi:hypothetical protein
MEAEAIRDAILAVSGRLDRRMYGMSVHPYRERENADRRLFPGPLDGDGRRSIYIKNNLMEAPHFLSAFDFPGGKVTQGRRDVTSVPAQALALLNDPFVLQQAEVWARSGVTRNFDTPSNPVTQVASRIDQMFLVALGRPANREEEQRFSRAMAALAELHGVPGEEVIGNAALWKEMSHMMFNLREFITIP